MQIIAGLQLESANFQQSGDKGCGGVNEQTFHGKNQATARFGV